MKLLLCVYAVRIFFLDEDKMNFTTILPTKSFSGKSIMGKPISAKYSCTPETLDQLKYDFMLRKRDFKLIRSTKFMITDDKRIPPCDNKCDRFFSNLCSQPKFLCVPKPDMTMKNLRKCSQKSD